MRGLAKTNTNRKRKTRKLLQAGMAPAAAWPEERGLRVPTRWVKFLCGIFLLPVVIVLTQTFFTCLSRETLQHAFWKAPEFLFFSVGALVWLAVFFLFPKPVRVYVLGHEYTHAIWVWLMGGRVSEIQHASSGGYILTDTNNFWIALAPYFYPIYSMFVLVAYGALSCFVEMAPYHHWFFAALGATWCFHITFTVWMIPKGQTDLTANGTFFSLIVIYLMNLAILSVMLIVASTHVSFAGFGRDLLESSVRFFDVWFRAFAAFRSLA